MRALFTDDPGIEGKRYTVSGNEGVLFGAFDTQEEVVELVKSKPDGACTIRFEAGVPWDGPEFGELARKIEWLGREVWKCPLCAQEVVLVEGGHPRLSADYFTKCKLTEHLCGIECLAFRQPTRARELLAEQIKVG